MSDLDYIRDYYGVPAKRGARVEYEGKPGTVTGTSGPHITVKLDGGKHSLPYHPDDLKWLDAERPLERPEQALARVSAEMRSEVEKLRSGDLSDSDPELLALAAEVTARLDASPLSENAQPPVQPTPTVEKP
jgi:hypothetical protein